MSISIAILWKEMRIKIKYSQEIGFIVELQNRAEKEGSMTPLALDNHTGDGSLTLHWGGLCISREDPCLRACFGHVALAFAINIPLTRVLFWSWSWVHLHCVWGPAFLEILCAKVSPGLFGWPPSPASDFEPPSSTKFRHLAPYKPLRVIHIVCLHRLQNKTRTNFPRIILSHHLLIR